MRPFVSWNLEVVIHWSKGIAARIVASVKKATLELNQYYIDNEVKAIAQVWHDPESFILCMLR